MVHSTITVNQMKSDGKRKMALKPKVNRRNLLLFLGAIAVSVFVAVFGFYGYLHYQQWSNRQRVPIARIAQAERANSPADIQEKVVQSAALEKEHAREKIISDNTIQGRVTIPRSPSIEIFPVLLDGIPNASSYRPVGLKSVKVSYTEREFRKEREEWYRKLMVEEYLRVGHRDPKWNDRVIAFLTESARRLAVRRYQELRHTEFDEVQFPIGLAEEGASILELGCNEPLVRAMLIEELYRRRQSYEGFLEGTHLIANLNIDSYSELAKFMVFRPLFYWDDFTSYRVQATIHFRKSLIHADFSRTSRRIMYYEGQMLLQYESFEAIPEFILSLNFDEDVDPWLRNMLMADFYHQIAIDASLLSYFWYSYSGVARDNPTALRTVHTDHLRRAYLYYLQAWKIDSELVEAPWRLFRMSFEQEVSYINMTSSPPERLILERLSNADPRYWLDQIVAKQFDFLPIYRLYLSKVNPPREAGNDSTLYRELMQFGAECLESGQFGTSIPLLYYDALLAVVKKLDSAEPRNSNQNNLFFACQEFVEPLERMLTGYNETFSTNQQNYFSTLIACVLWHQGKFEEAIKRFESQPGNMHANAFRDMFLDHMGVVRAHAGRKTYASPPGAGIVVNAELSSRDNHLLLSLADGRVGHWDILHQRFEEKFRLGDEQEVSDAAIAISENAAFVSVYQSPSIQIFNAESFAKMVDLAIGPGIQSHLVSRAGHLLACENGKDVQIWNLPERKAIASIPLRIAATADQNSSNHVCNCTFSEDDSLFAFVVTEPRPADATRANKPMAPPNRLAVWNLEQQKIVYDGSPFSLNITSVRFCDDGHKLIVAGTDWSEEELFGTGYGKHHRIRILNLASGKIDMEFSSFNALRSAMEFGHDGSQLVAFDNKQVLVFDRKTGKELSSIRPFADKIAHLVCDMRTSKLVALDDRGRIVRIDESIKEGRNLVSVIPDLCRQSFPMRVSVEPNRKLVALCDGIEGGTIWRLSEGKSVGYNYRETSEVGTRAFAFSADLRQLATSPSTYTQTLKDFLFDWKIRVARATTSRLSYSETLKRLSSALADTKIQLWDTSAHRIVRTLEGCGDEICCADFSPNGKLFVAGLKNGSVVIWDLRSDSSLAARVLGDQGAAITVLCFSASGERLLTAANKGDSFGKTVLAKLQLWEVASNLEDCKVVNQFEFPQQFEFSSDIQNLDFSDDGKFILASDAEKTCVYSLQEGIIVEVLGSLAKFRPNDTSFIVTNSKNTTMTTFWHYDIKGEQIRTFATWMHNPISSFTFSPDGNTIMVSGPSNGLAAWEVESGNRVMFISDVFDKNRLDSVRTE